LDKRRISSRRTISEKDLELISVVDTPDEILYIIDEFYKTTTQA